MTMFVNYNTAGMAYGYYIIIANQVIFDRLGTLSVSCFILRRM